MEMEVDVILFSHWSYRRVTPGCYSYVRGCVLAGVEQLYTGNLLTGTGTLYAQLARRIYSLATEMADRYLAETIRVK